MTLTYPSPNFGPRKGGVAPDTVIIHYTAMESCAAAVARLCEPEHEVSAHYVVSGAGQVIPLVAEECRAWHAGRSYWQGDTDINSRSIGIELDYPGCLSDFPPFPHTQTEALVDLLRNIMSRWSVSPHRVLGHSDVSPGRKADPGPKFDWAALAALGLARPVPAYFPLDADTAGFVQHMRRIGYDPSAGPEALLAAFRLRWRPLATGSVDATDMGLAKALAVDHSPTTS